MPRLPENPPPLQIVPNTSIDGGKYVALTFDDGPNNTTTPRLLDMLKSSHVPATFYVLGSQVERFPEVAKRIVHEGHEIGNHSWSHPQLTKLDRDAVWKQIDATNQVIFDTTGVYPK